eukprot:268931-Pyramimonas_sp.AAC.1
MPYGAVKPVARSPHSDSCEDWCCYVRLVLQDAGLLARPLGCVFDLFRRLVGVRADVDLPR